MDTDTFRIEDAVSFTFDETDPLALLRIDTDRSFYTMSASETLSLLPWLWQRRDVICKKSQEEEQ
jgi:hypothetical protein